MLHWLKYPFLRFTPALIIGIFLHTRIEIGATVIWTLLITFTTTFCVLLIFFRKRFFSLNPILGFNALILLMIFGLVISRLHVQKNHNDHFSNFQFDAYTAVLNDWPERTNELIRTTAKVNKIKIKDQWHRVSGDVQVYLPAIDIPVIYGTRLLVSKPPAETREPRNPREFNYKHYLANQNVYHQQFLKHDEFVIIGADPSNRIVDTGFKIRAAGSRIISKYLEEDAQGIIKALLLGIRGDIDEELRDAYAHAGAIHILAISGLHLGIIYGFLLVAFRRYRKRIWFVALTIIILWSFAIIAGLPPSVSRAALMFSIISIGQVFYRTPNIFNTIALSAFILLIIDPFQLFHVGFQLSYLAVIGIVWLYPYVNAWISSRYWFIEKMWSLLALTFSAQALTFPLVLYYFHNYPSLSFISNLVVVPLTTLILLTGLVFLVSGAFQLLFITGLIAKVLTVLVQLMNGMVVFIERLPRSYISDIWLRDLDLVFLYAIIFSLLGFLFLKKFNWFVTTSGVWILFVGILFSHNLQRKNLKRIIFYNIPGTGSFDFIENARVYNHTDPQELNNLQKVNYASINLRLANTGTSKSIPMIVQDAPLPNTKLMVLAGKRFTVINGPLDQGFESRRPIAVDYLVISKNSVSNLNNLDKLFAPGRIILDSSNDYYYSSWASKKLTDLGIANYNVRQEGYLHIDLLE